MRLGIIGVGHLSATILQGWLRAGRPARQILLSPRGRGAELSATQGFGLAADNAEVVRDSDIVLLAVRPADAAGAIEGLPWRAGQILASACAGVPIARLAEVARPAEPMRIMPITASALGASPTVVFPHHAALDPLLSAIGTAIVLDSEAQFEAATVSAAVYGWVKALIRDTADWSARRGLDETAARQLVARTFVAAGRMLDEQDAPMDRLIDSVVTPGGITEAGMTRLGAAGVPEAWLAACAVVLAQLDRRS